MTFPRLACFLHLLFMEGKILNRYESGGNKHDYWRGERDQKQ